MDKENKWKTIYPLQGFQYISRHMHIIWTRNPVLREQSQLTILSVFILVIQIKTKYQACYSI